MLSSVRPLNCKLGCISPVVVIDFVCLSVALHILIVHVAASTTICVRGTVLNQYTLAREGLIYKRNQQCKTPVSKSTFTSHSIAWTLHM